MGFFSKAYKSVQKLKPKELTRYGDAVPLILGAINPIAGAIAGAGRIARRAYEDKLAEDDAENAQRALDQAAAAASNSPTSGVPSPSPSPPPFIPYGGSGGGSSGGGIPVALFTQLGRAVGQQSAAVRTMLAKAAGSRGGRMTQRRRKSKKKAAAPRARKRRSSKGNKFKKGSAAAKRHMAKLRRMRK